MPFVCLRPHFALNVFNCTGLTFECLDFLLFFFLTVLALSSSSLSLKQTVQKMDAVQVPLVAELMSLQREKKQRNLWI